jgi:hypothetical protein
MARDAFRRALTHEFGPSACRPVRIRAAGREIEGYFSSPGPLAPCVILVNGLDSIAEVELQAFGRWFVARGLAVLSLNVPVDYATEDGSAMVDFRALAPSVCDWVQVQCELEHCCIFGVSFGGHLAAQFLAADARVVGGAAVCPPAFIGPDEMKLERIRVMWACALRRPWNEVTGRERDLPDLRDLGPPLGDFLLIGCYDDPVFGENHLEVYRKWGRHRVSVQMLESEHVGTSRYSDWLPDACDWICDRFGTATLTVGGRTDALRGRSLWRW